LIALFATIGLRRPGFPAMRHLVSAAVVAALLPALIPFGTVMNGTAAIDSFGLGLSGTEKAGQAVPVAHATTLIVCLSALLAVVFLLAVRRLLPPMAAVLITAIPLLGLSMLEIAKQVTPIAQAQTGLPAHPDWVDRTVGSHANVSLVGGADKAVAPLRETAFWNSSITRVYYTCGAAFGPDFGEQQLTAGTSIPVRYVVVPESMRISGRVLARDREGKLVLVAPTGGTLRVSSTLRCKR
jgi:hypothetical protein